MMSNLSPQFFEEPIASELEQKRDMQREKRRLTYDCFNAIVDGDRVHCKIEGKNLAGRIGFGLPLLSILRGRSTTMCQECSEYVD